MDTEDMDIYDIKCLIREKLDSYDIKDLFFEHYDYYDVLEEIDTETIFNYLGKNPSILLELVIDLFEKHKLDIIEKETFISRIKDYL